MASWFPPNEPSSIFLRVQLSQAKVRAELARIQDAIASIEQLLLSHPPRQPTDHAQPANLTTDMLRTKISLGAQGANSRDTTFFDISYTTTVFDCSDHANAGNAAVYTVNECDTLTSTPTGRLIHSTLRPTLSTAPRPRSAFDPELFAISTLSSGTPHSRSPGFLAFPASTTHPLPRPPPEPDPTK
jgi:hypothetical protein